MVWKVKYFLFACFMLVLVGLPTMQVKAANFTVYADGNLSSTIVNYFKDYNIPIDSNYVIFRNTQYEYIMACSSKLTYDNGFKSPDKTTLYYITTTNYNSIYTVHSSSVANFNLSNNNNNIVYSNVGDFPDIFDRGVSYEFYTFFTLCILCLCLVIRSIFTFVLRYRRG